jgi:HK97 family phage prohead protease
MRTKFATVRLKTTPTDGSGTFTAIVSTIGGEADAQNDIIAAGAYDKTIREWRAKRNLPTIWWMHGYEDPINAIGKLTDIRVEGDELLVSGKLDLANVRAQNVYEGMLTGKLNEFSIGYAVRAEHFDKALSANVITDLELLEVSVVFAGANRHTELVSVKTGARNSAADQERIQMAHDQLAAAGAICVGVTSGSDGKTVTEQLDALERDIETRLSLAKLERSLSIEGRVEDLARTTRMEQDLRDLERELKSVKAQRAAVDRETRRQVFGPPRHVVTAVSSDPAGRSREAVGQVR